MSSPNSPAPRLPAGSALLVGTGLAFASLILVPAMASRLGMGSALTGAVRIALMRASARIANGSQPPREGEGETAPVCFACH